MELSLQTEQKQQLTREQKLSLDMLALTNQELETFLTEEYLENPLLECSIDKKADLIDSLEGFYEQGASFRDEYMRWDGTGADSAEDDNRRGDVADRGKSLIEEQILFQLDEESYTDRERELIRYLIACLDEKGFFPYTAEEVASDSGYDQDDIERILTDLRRLEPAGIFAKDIGDCLCAQLVARGETDEALYTLVRRHLPDLLAGKISSVTRALSLSTSRVREYIRLIGTLNPRPLMSLAGEAPTYVVPDILISREKEGWRITLNDNWMGEYRLDAYYLKMMQETKDSELKNYFREKVRRAHALIDAIERRRRTILAVTGEVIARQEDFFTNGAQVKPMTMEEIAGALGIHVSTVSRAVKGKYLSCRKTVPMKDLFSAAAGNTDASASQIMTRISSIVEKEDAKKPLSDACIAKMLQQEGMDVARRTVAKYRIRMGIPDSRQRTCL